MTPYYQDESVTIYYPPYGDDMTCLRCGQTWMSDE